MGNGARKNPKRERGPFFRLWRIFQENRQVGPRSRFGFFLAYAGCAPFLYPFTPQNQQETRQVLQFSQLAWHKSNFHPHECQRELPISFFHPAKDEAKYLIGRENHLIFAPVYAIPNVVPVPFGAF